MSNLKDDDEEFKVQTLIAGEARSNSSNTDFGMFLFSNFG
jgi:hypothetical protein